MQKIVAVGGKKGLVSLLGEKVLLLCSNYFYAGRLVDVGKTYVRLDNAKIVYDTGDWGLPSWKDAQSLGTEPHYVRLAHIESFRLSNK